MKHLENCYGAEVKSDGSRIPSEEVTRQQAEFLKALSDPARIRIVFALKDGELCVCEIMALLDMPQTMVSHHCKILKYAGIVTDRKEGKWVLYSLAKPKALDVLEMIKLEI
jgi:ArsR family transcriptional regulator, lead/cadmium/zinc/bismuth-responsive transcriptional repressor